MLNDGLRTDYDRIAGMYDIDRAHWDIPPDPLVASLLDEGRTGISVLDVGCGTGLYLCAQREHFRGSPVGWLGVDPSAQMLLNAAMKAPDLPLSQGRAEALPVRDAAADHVYSSFAFHHFTDKEKALDEIERVVRPGGSFRMRNMDPWGQPNWWLYQNFARTRENDEKRFWPASRIEAALQRRGFHVDAEVDVEHVSRTAADVLEEAERRVISQLVILDDESFEAGIARLRAIPPDTSIPYEHAGLDVVARKR
jgi:ubiquinone/menaquinone biosynthesis C-methylase UbiE